MEMLEYAKLHDVEFVSFFENQDGDGFTSAFAGSHDARSSYVVAILEGLDDSSCMYAFSVAAGYMSQRFPGSVSVGDKEEAPPPNPKFSILWGLIKVW